MTSAAVKIDVDLIAAAAAATAGIDTTMTPGDQVRAMLRHLAGVSKTPSAVSEGGEAPNRAGRNWENAVIDHASAQGFPWQRTRRRARRDLLDVVGSLDNAGLLVGCKAVQRGVPMSKKLWAAMDQCHRALGFLPRNVDAERVIPVQVIQRAGAPVGHAYAVTELDWFLTLAAERQQTWEGPQWLNPPQVQQQQR